MLTTVWVNFAAFPEIPEPCRSLVHWKSSLGEPGHQTTSKEQGRGCAAFGVSVTWWNQGSPNPLGCTPMCIQSLWRPMSKDEWYSRTQHTELPGEVNPPVQLPVSTATDSQRWRNSLFSLLSAAALLQLGSTLDQCRGHSTELKCWASQNRANPAPREASS